MTLCQVHGGVDSVWAEPYGHDDYSLWAEPYGHNGKGLAYDYISTSDVSGEMWETASSSDEAWNFEEPILSDAEVISRLSLSSDTVRCELLEPAVAMVKLLSQGPFAAAEVALRGPLARQATIPAWTRSIDILVFPGPETTGDILVLRLSNLCKLKLCHIERLPRFDSARFTLISWPGLSNPQNVQLTVEITCVDREDQFRRLLAAEDAVHDLAASAGGRMTQSLGAAPEATFNAYLLLVQAFAAQVLPEGAMTRAQAICLALYALQRPLPGQQSLERRGQDLFHDFLHFCVDFFGEDWCEKRLCDLLAIDVNGSAWRRLAADSGCELYMYTPPKGDAAVASNIGQTIQTEAVAQGARELLCAGYDLGDGQIRQTDFR